VLEIKMVTESLTQPNPDLFLLMGELSRAI